MPLLLERGAHLEAIAAAIAATQSGRGSVVLLEGPAGIGKSALLAAARRPGVARHLRARGGELERELPLAVARQLLEPPLMQADAARRERLLEGTGPARAALEGRTGTGDEDAPALLHGLQRLMYNLAAESLLVVEVDDVQWADAASLRFLCFLIRRLGELPIAVLLARRTGEFSIDETALEAIADAPLTERRVLEPLSATASRQVIADSNGGGADARFANACHAASAGNRFLLHELLRALAGANVPFDADGAERVLDTGLPAVGRWVLRRLERLSPGATRLARSVAVLGPHADLGRSARLAGLSLGEAAQLLDALVAQDILLAGRPLDFIHPVLRAAVHDAIPPGERSTTHRAAARLLHEHHLAPDAAATHLLAAEPGGEAWAAEALLDGARLALARGAPEVAAAQAERALAEPPVPELRNRLLRTLGMAERRLGLATADARFLTAYEASTDPRERAHILLEAVITGGLEEHDAIPQMRQTLSELEHTDPHLALMLRARMLVAMETSREPLDPEFDSAAAALAAHPENSLGARSMAASLAFYRAVTVGARQEVVALGARAVGDDAAYSADLDAGYPHIFAILALSFVDAFELSELRIDAALARADERGSLLGIASARSVRARMRRRCGQLAAAVEDAQAALESAAQTSDRAMTAMCAAIAAEGLMDLGRLDEATTVIHEHVHLVGRVAPPAQAELLTARAALNLACGDPAKALADATSAGHLMEAIGCRNPNATSWRSRAGHALVALARSEDASTLALEALQIAQATEIPGAIGEARRLVAAATYGEPAIEQLRRAVVALEEAPAPLGLARALLDLGAALRRSGRRREAREPLGRALELAHRHGARPLQDAVRTELRTAGARPRREMRTGVDALTPSERRVADLAASGLPNAQIAARLFITRKTTEHHLASAYRKLGISSRGELPTVFDRSRIGGSSDPVEADGPRRLP
jgi:DNA-binding CsgD family transcriptional regulator